MEEFLGFVVGGVFLGRGRRFSKSSEANSILILHMRRKDKRDQVMRTKEENKK